MTKNEILEYVMTTPENVNRQVLSYMLNEISSTSSNNISIDIPTISILEYDEDYENLTVDFSTLDDFPAVVKFVDEDEYETYGTCLVDAATGISFLLIWHEWNQEAYIYSLNVDEDSRTGTLTFEAPFQIPEDTELQTYDVRVCKDAELSDIDINISLINDYNNIIVNVPVEGTVNASVTYSCLVGYNLQVQISGEIPEGKNIQAINTATDIGCLEPGQSTLSTIDFSAESRNTIKFSFWSGVIK